MPHTGIFTLFKYVSDPVRAVTEQDVFDLLPVDRSQVPLPGHVEGKGTH